MSGVKDIQQNSFPKGMNLDAADLIMPNDTMRFGQNVRLVNREGSSFLVTNLQGNEQSFALTDGFVPVAAQEFAGVLYIVSWHTDGRLECGTFPSPNWTAPLTPNVNTGIYRPIYNFNDGAAPFSTTKLKTSSKPVIQKLEIQPDYDESVNMCFSIKGGKPRIVNSRFKASNNGTIFSILSARSGTVSSNTYTEDTVEKETSTLLFSTKILKIGVDTTVKRGFEIQNGGKLKPGNYTYIFYYMTEDFNRTSVIGQSSICQIAFGNNIENIRGGDQTEETDKKVRLTLSNIDVDFKYIKIYVQYSSGTDSLQEQYLEMVQPIKIENREEIDFYHSGFEELKEVPAGTVDVDYAPIEQAGCSTQAGGFYFLADITERSVFVDDLRAAARSVLPYAAEKVFNTAGVSLPLYTDPYNVYNYVGNFSGETYPYGVVFIMNDGTLSPAFPIRGLTHADATNQFSHALDNNDNKGLVTFSNIRHKPFFNSSQQITIKHLRMNVNALIDNLDLRSKTVGFFFVRGERRRNALTQGILLPTIKAPAIEHQKRDENKTFYEANKNENDTNLWKQLINLDSLMEAYALRIDNSDNDRNVIKGDDGSLQNGYEPISMDDGGTTKWLWRFDTGSTDINNPFRNSGLSHWGLISGEALYNEPEYVTLLQRDSMGIHQFAKVNFKVSNLIEDIDPILGGPPDTANHYSMISTSNYSTVVLKKAKRIVYVPAETLATGTDFSSKIKTAIVYRKAAGIVTTHTCFLINQHYNSYFGLVMDEHLSDDTIGPNNPIGAAVRDGMVLTNVPSNNEVCNGMIYDNLNKVVPAGFLVNVYPRGTKSTPDDLYPSLDGVVYKQIGQRYTWSELKRDVFIDVFGGDNYISRVSRQLNYGPERNSSVLQTDKLKRWNIDSGMFVTWWQESKYNLHLRQPKTYAAGELEKRTFFPYRNLGDPIEHRKYRYPEINTASPGYGITTPPKSFFTVSALAPSIQNRFINRIYHSEKHIPNAFRNGYRSFLETSFRDYDAGMGAIIAMFSHQGGLLVIFEHGIGITAIESRVETGADAAGKIFIEASDVLPPTLTYLSREIGCQHPQSLIQTPGAVYGVDASKDKIWKITTGLKVISDESVASWIISNPALNPKSGYDFENNEVIFRTDNWTLCFTEGLEKFTSFYTMNEAEFFARRNKALYSFIGKQAYLHNSLTTYNLYGNEKEVILEFVVNKNISAAKTVDWLNIISNEVPPTKVEFYSYNQETDIGPTINTGNLNQYAKLDYGIDPITEEPNIFYRDKKFSLQVPYRTEYATGSNEDNWGVEGRVRDKVIIVRLTYQTDKSFELATVLSNFRYSMS